MRITDKFVLPEGNLKDAVLRLEKEHEEARRLLGEVSNFGLSSAESSCDPSATQYIHTKSMQWIEIRRRIRAFLAPHQPIELRSELTHDGTRLEVWLKRGTEKVDLFVHHDYLIASDGSIYLHDSREKIWEERKS
jgi:hypothetical protein